jgi:hypothetical protein
MSEATGKILWRVEAADGSSQTSAFDALVLATNSSDQDRLARPSRLIGLDVPYERELPDVPLTLIVRTRTGSVPLQVFCDVRGPDGERTVFGRAGRPLAVIVRTSTGILLTGLPDGEDEPQFDA